jgi:ribosome biogenesis protein ENP2
LQILTEDYSKMAFLTADRGLEFHTRMGKLHTTRVPKAGRDLAYLPHLAQLIVGGSAPEIWRLSLYEGRFLPPLRTVIDGVNALGVCPAHGMVAAGGAGGLLECWDAREKGSLGAISAAAAMGFAEESVTALRFDASGYHLAAGTSGASRPHSPLSIVMCCLLDCAEPCEVRWVQVCICAGIRQPAAHCACLAA